MTPLIEMRIMMLAWIVGLALLALEPPLWWHNPHWMLWSAPAVALAIVISIIAVRRWNKPPNA